MLLNKDNYLPVIPLKDTVIFPGMVIGLATTTKKAKMAAEAAYQNDKHVLFLTQKDSKKRDLKLNDLYDSGTVGVIRQFLRTNGDIKLIVEGLYRVRVKNEIQDSPYLKVKIQKINKIIKNEEEIIALKNKFSKDFKGLIDRGKMFPVEVMISVLSTPDPDKLIDLVIPYLDSKIPEKQVILKEEDLEERFEEAIKVVDHNIALANLEQKLTSDTKEELNKFQKEAYLREQLKTIQKELGEKGENEFSELELKIKDAGMPEETEVKARKELERLRSMPSFSPEVGFIRTYLDWLVSMPWAKKSADEIDIKKAEKILDEDHYGLEKAKQRIIEYLSVQKITGKVKGPILLFVGPPGTGKTSIGKSIARATGRKFARMSLGGIRDEAEIRGHRRTYVGALPGRIIQGIKTAGSKNPIFMLDEIDKVGADFRGDPSSALLEALDPEQNNQFSDHYLEVPYDLSDVLFITTANILDTIPPALRDRMEIIPFPGYTEDEKFFIAKKFLFQKQMKLNGLDKYNIKIEDTALREMIGRYTREAGVRELERNLAAVARKITRKISEGEKYQPIINSESLRGYLGPDKYLPLTLERKNLFGSSYALAVTPAGGEVLSVETALMPGKGKLILTGQLGNIMKESAQAALTYVRSKLAEKDHDNFLKNQDIHIHVPAGAVPKDGPSAGTAITTSLYSLLTKKLVRGDVAMTGEVTLRGLVLRIGGIKEKVLAASRAGLKTVIVPMENKSDLEDVPIKTREKMEIILASSLDEVFNTALVK